MTDITHKMTDEADANLSIVQTWSGASWGSAATYRTTNAGGDYFELFPICDALTLWQTTAHGIAGTGSHAVMLDGSPIVGGDWDQDNFESYTIDGLSYGVHKIRVTCAVDQTLCIGHIILHQNEYAGKGKPGDAVEIIHVQPFLYATTIGTGPTNNGAYYPSPQYGEAITPRLPLPTSCASDRVFLRDYLDPGQPYWGANSKAGFLRLPIEYPREALGTDLSYDHRLLQAGMTITLGAAASVRGYRPTTLVVCWARDLDTAVIHLQFVPFIGRVTATGAGSVLTVGELVLGIGVVSDGGATTRNWIGWYNGYLSAVDFFKIPASLL